MGYDMRTVTRDPGEAEAVATIREQLNLAYKEQRGADADKLYEAMQEAEKSYFRLNIWGMGNARELMHSVGMLDLEYTDKAEFPSEKDFGVAPEMWDDWDGEPNEKTPEPLRKFLAACDAVTDYQKPEPTGIPVHKLGSNDGWLVTPDEIASALKALGDRTPTGAPNWWDEWIGYLKYAQEHGGFRVH